MRVSLICVLTGLVALSAKVEAEDSPLQPIPYNNPGLVVDLGVGLWAWPLPMDYDRDGDLDLVVSCPDKPSNGTYFFENTSDGKEKFPVFKPGKKIGRGFHNARVSHVDGKPIVLVENKQYANFRTSQYEKPEILQVDTSFMKGRKTRARQWHRVDYNGDGLLDVVIGYGDWTEYGWDDAYNNQGVWTNGPLRGRMRVAINTGTNDEPTFESPVEIKGTDGKTPEVYGWPSPNFADWDGDGDLDLLCGEFRDTFTYFENVGSRTEPEYADGVTLIHNGDPLEMDLQMIVPSTIDWDGDDDLDLIVGDEDGRVALIENTGKLVDRVPQFLPPRYFQQEAEFIKFGALATPYACDWDADGDQDILCGNTAGYIGFIENLGGDETPKWAAPQRLEAGGETFRIEAGPNGSIQGPCEEKWGYTTLSVNDWNGDGLPDIVFNSIWGRIQWLENIGTPTEPKLAAAKPIQVEWEGDTPKPAWTWWQPVGKELVTQWRTTPVVVDWNGDGLNDLIVLDTEGYPAFFERQKVRDQLILKPGKRIFLNEQGEPLQLNPKQAGGSGRRKVEITDWDGDGRLDLLLNSKNADWYHNLGETPNGWKFKNVGPLYERPLAGHTSSPAVVDWNKDGIPDLLVGAEDGYLYYAKNPRAKSD
ncbi:MAG: VCBS repeat-containing protein [Planctomycetaceae bacterium]|nr:VCBS repeat-containing protein [Planctomycetaceae bacterium]